MPDMIRREGEPGALPPPNRFVCVLLWIVYPCLCVTAQIAVIWNLFGARP